MVSTMLTSADPALNWIMWPEDSGSLGAYVGGFVLSYPCATVRSMMLATVSWAIERGYRFVKGCSYEEVSRSDTSDVSKDALFSQSCEGLGRSFQSWHHPNK